MQVELISKDEQRKRIVAAAKAVKCAMNSRTLYSSDVDEILAEHQLEPDYIWDVMPIVRAS